MDGDSLLEAVTTLGALLEDRGQSVEVAAVGGGALLLSGLARMPTKDLDLVARRIHDQWTLAEPLPPELIAAARDVADQMQLGEDWVNAGPSFLFRVGLPEGFFDRATRRRFGGVVLLLAAREDQIALKLFAAAMSWPVRNRHFRHLEELKPSPDEWAMAVPWCRRALAIRVLDEPREGPLESLLDAMTGVLDAMRGPHA